MEKNIVEKLFEEFEALVLANPDLPVVMCAPNFHRKKGEAEEVFTGITEYFELRKRYIEKAKELQKAQVFIQHLRDSMPKSGQGDLAFLCRGYRNALLDLEGLLVKDKVDDPEGLEKRGWSINDVK